MRTTVRLRDDLLRRARQRAAREGRTLTSLIEEGLNLVLTRPVKGARRERVDLPVSSASGGVLPGVDLNRSADLEDVMTGR
jgi:hypothetical protein